MGGRKSLCVIFCFLLSVVLGSFVVLAVFFVVLLFKSACRNAHANGDNGCGSNPAPEVQMNEPAGS